jgi:hypothetical protein
MLERRRIRIAGTFVARPVLRNLLAGHKNAAVLVACPTIRMLLDQIDDVLHFGLERKAEPRASWLVEGNRIMQFRLHSRMEKDRLHWCFSRS